MREAAKRRAATSPTCRSPELRQFAPLVGDDVYAVLTLEGSLAARNHLGGTAPEQVHAAVRRARAELSR